jgi:hypothetical protein
MPANRIGGHLGVAGGGVIDDVNPGTGLRVELGVSRVKALGSRPGDGAFCNDKGDCMASSSRRSLRQLGVAAAWSGIFVDDDSDDGLRLSRPWRVSLIAFWERSALDAY